MKPEILRAVPAKRSKKASVYAVCMAVGYPGDFALSGRHWRVVTGQIAKSSDEAFGIFL